MLNLPLPLGFQGLHPDKPVTMYERHLPHWRQDGATYFVTFRIGDSIPQNRLRELEGLRREWERRNPPPRATTALEQLAREISIRVERWLDQGHGSCELQHAHLAKACDGNLWQEESFDRIVRDDEHLWRALQYIGRNPEKARLPRGSCPMWVRPEWESLGWTFEWRRQA